MGKNNITLFICFVTFTLLAPTLWAMPNFKNYPNGPKRHNAFFNYLRPLVQQHNAIILANRHKLQLLYRKKFTAKQQLTVEQKKWLHTLSHKYRMHNLATQQQWRYLINRVDIIPTSLALAQAANETAYGITRFAQNANNFYGIWCYTKGCGIVPHQRKQGKIYEIKKYPTVSASITDYMLLLNTQKAYNIFRDLRAQERTYSNHLSGIVLASGLLSYSQRREIYIESLQKIIITNKLEKTINYNL